MNSIKFQLPCDAFFLCLGEIVLASVRILLLAGVLLRWMQS